MATFDALEGLPLAVEVRHASWDEPEFWELLESRCVSYCAVDQPAHPHNLSALARTTAVPAYLRLHGRNRAHWFAPGAGRDQRYDYLYNDVELAGLAEKAMQMAEQAAPVYVIANNHYRGQAVANALQLKALLRRLASGPMTPTMAALGGAGETAHNGARGAGEAVHNGATRVVGEAPQDKRQGLQPGGPKIPVPPWLCDRYPELRSIAAAAPTPAPKQPRLRFEGDDP